MKIDWTDAAIEAATTAHLATKPSSSPIRAALDAAAAAQCLTDKNLFEFAWDWSRRKALEEAAQACEALGWKILSFDYVAGECAAAIRALKEKQG
jgi:hypothetical protein